MIPAVLAMAPGRGSGDGDGEIAVQRTNATCALQAGPCGTPVAPERRRLPVKLLNPFTIAGDNGDSFHTPWVPAPPDYDRVEFWTDCKMFNATQFSIDLESSMDMTEEGSQGVATSTITATGVDVTEATSKVGAYLRLKITIDSAAGYGVVSAWALPKRA